MSSLKRITRETQVESSVIEYVRQALVSRGYPAGDWRMLDSFPYDLQKLDRPVLIATGFTYDDGGAQFECGSNLKERKYTIEFFVFGQTLTWAKSIANAIKFAIEQDSIIPLLDIDTLQPVDPPEVIELDLVHARRQPLAQPTPAQEFTWLISSQFTDWYQPSLT